MDYRQAGVDIEAGRTFVEKIRDSVARTHRLGVLGDLGGFGGCFELPTGYRQPVLVSGTDGVGTKLKIAQAANKHDTIGIDRLSCRLHGRFGFQFGFAGGSLAGGDQLLTQIP